MNRQDPADAAEWQRQKHVEFPCTDPSMSINFVYAVNCATCGYSESFGDAEDAEDAASEHSTPYPYGPTDAAGTILPNGLDLYGFGYTDEEIALLKKHDKDEELHAFVEGREGKFHWQCDECGDTAEGLMHNNTWRNVEPLMDNDDADIEISPGVFQWHDADGVWYQGTRSNYVVMGADETEGE